MPTGGGSSVVFVNGAASLFGGLRGVLVIIVGVLAVLVSLV